MFLLLIITFNVDIEVFGALFIIWFLFFNEGPK